MDIEEISILFLLKNVILILLILKQCYSWQKLDLLFIIR